MTTMLDKCAVAGDITQGIDRRGVWTAAITVIGGTSGTAVKLVSSDTVNGVYTDYKTLISAADAGTDQYKGFVVDLHGAKKYIKVTGATMATAVFGDCDHDVKNIAITAGEVPSGADLEDNKAATINASTYTEPVEVTPSEGKDGMKKATITLTNIPSGATPSTEMPAWFDDYENSCVPSGLQIVGVNGSSMSNTIIITGDGQYSITALLGDSKRFHEALVSYGESIVFAYDES